MRIEAPNFSCPITTAMNYQWGMYLDSTQIGKRLTQIKLFEFSIKNHFYSLLITLYCTRGDIVHLLSAFISDLNLGY